MKSAKRCLIAAICILLVVGVSSASVNCITDSEAFASGRDKKNVLLLGRDGSSGLADAIILAMLDGDSGSLTLLQIPRDTYLFTKIDSYKKINGASAVLGSDTALCKRLSEAFGIVIDGYISFDTRLVRDAVDMLGGVELNVPMDMDYEDPYQGLSIHLKAGKQRLTGSQAVGFVRFRAGYLRADLGRVDAQKLFLAAFARSAFEKLGKEDFLALVGAAVKYLKTDLPVTSLTMLAKAVMGLTTEDISFATLPGEEVRSSQSGAWFYILSRPACEELFAQLGAEGGFDPLRMFSDSSRLEFEEIYNKNIKTEVYNAAEIDGEGIDIIPKNKTKDD